MCVDNNAGKLNAKLLPHLCFCKSIQTSSYEVAKGSYVPTPTLEQMKENNMMVCFALFELLTRRHR